MRKIIFIVYVLCLGLVPPLLYAEDRANTDSYIGFTSDFGFLNNGVVYGKKLGKSWLSLKLAYNRSYHRDELIHNNFSSLHTSLAWKRRVSESDLNWFIQNEIGYSWSLVKYSNNFDSGRDHGEDYAYTLAYGLEYFMSRRLSVSGSFGLNIAYSGEGGIDYIRYRLPETHLMVNYYW